MTFLPIVERELRVLARRPSTYRWRWIIGGIAFTLALMLLAMMGIGGRPNTWGQALFVTMVVYAASVSLMAGLFGTADLISEERREGTLGLLFLTDLKGYDVIIGKFSAVALNAFYWLLAIIPVLAMPLLIGGVTFGEFGRVSLALFNLLFFTMAVGTWASVRSLEVYRSLLLAVGVMVVFCAFNAAWFMFMHQSGTQAQWAFFTGSPVLPLWVSNSSKYSAMSGVYWYSLLSAHLVAWCFLFLAIWKVPQVWRQPARETGSFMPGPKAHRHDATNFAQRARWLDDNPALFLMRPQRTIRVLAVIAVIAATLLLLVDFLFIDKNSFFFIPVLGGVIEWFVLIPLKVLLVVHASRFFSEARQSGVFELLLSTPLTTGEIIKAHWTVINRTFLWPFMIISFFMVFCTLKVFVSGNHGGNETFAFFGLGIKIIAHVFDYFLLGWMSAWMALRSKKPGWAPFLTILFALVLPSMFCWLGYLAKPVLIAIARHHVVYELPKLARKQYDDGFNMAATIPLTTPPPLS